MLEHVHTKPYPGDGGLLYLPESDQEELGPPPTEEVVSERHIVTVYLDDRQRGQIEIILPEQIIRFTGDAKFMEAIWHRWSQARGDAAAVVADMPRIFQVDSLLRFDWEHEPI